DVRRRVVEKLPLFGLTIFGSIMAVAGQKSLAAVQSMETVPMTMRISNAVVAYVRYLGKFFVPINLAVVYPLQPIAAGTAIACAVLLLAISAAAFHYRKAVPYAFT